MLRHRILAIACLGVLAAPAVSAQQAAPTATAAGQDTGTAPAAAAPVPTLDEIKSELDKKRFARAKVLAEGYLAAHADDAAAHFMLAKAWAGLKKPRNVIKPGYRAVELDGKNVDAWRLLAEALTSTKSEADAAKAWERVARLGKDREAALTSARLYAKVEKPKEAVASFVFARGLGALDTATQKELGPMALAVGDAAVAVETYGALVKAEPNEIAHKVALARALAIKDPAGGKAQLEEILKLDPKNLDALDGLAALAEAQKADVEAAALLARLRAAAPQHPSAHRRHGEVLVRQGKTDEARAAFLAQTRVKDDVASSAALARIEKAAGKPDAALPHARKAAQLDPKSVELTLLVGELLLAKGDAKAAVSAVEKLGESDAASIDLLAVYGRSLLLAKAPVKARRVFSRLVGQKDPRGYEGLGELAFDAGDFKAAAESLEKALPLHGDDADFHYKVAFAMLKSGAGAKAERLLAKALELNPKHEEASRAYGRALVEKGEIDRALPLLETARTKYPNDPEVAFAYGKAMFVKGDAAKARAALTTALAAAPQHIEANELAGVLAYRAGDKVVADKHLTIALKSSANAEALAAAGELRLEQNKVREADELFARALKADATSRAALLGMTKVRMSQDRADDAEKSIGGYLFGHADDREALLLGGAVAHARGEMNVVVERYGAAQKAGAGASAKLPAADGVRHTDALVRLGRFKEAVAAGKEALAAGAADARAFSVVAYAEYKTGDKAASRAHVEQALQKGADDAYVNLIRGEQLLEQSKRKEAKVALTKVTAVEPNNDRANTLLGDLALASGQAGEAAALYRKALKANAGLHSTRAQLVRALVEDNKAGDAQRELAKVPADAITAAERDTLMGRIQNKLGNFKKANDHFEAALKAAPGNAEAMYYQGENYLKMPHYSKAIELLEAARKADPSRAEVGERLAELYAETGEREKAAKTIAEVDALEAKSIEEKRKSIPKDQIKTVAVGRFVNTSKDPQHDWIGVGAAEALTADLKRIPELQPIEREQIEQVKAQLAEQIKNEDANADAVAAQLGKMVAAQWLLVGSYLVAGDSVRLNARLVDVASGKVERSASQAGGMNELVRLQKRLALELAGELVDIDEDERRSISRMADTNIESYRLAAEAKTKQYAGDLRGAQASYREALQADAGNVDALKGLDKAKKDLGTRNTVAIMDFSPVADAPTWIGAGLPEHMASKLSKVSGIQVVERGQIDKVQEELAFNVKNEDYVDKDKLPEVGKALAAGTLLVGSYQKAGDQVQLNARLIDISDNKTLLGDRVAGPEAELLQLQDELAKRIVYALVGAPSPEEAEALKSKQTLAEYKTQMEELARLREEERKRKEAAATAVAAAPAEEPKPEEVKPEETAATEQALEVAAADAAASLAGDGSRKSVGLDLRFAKGASGFVPGLYATLAEYGWEYGYWAFTATWAGDNLGGGRNVDRVGDDGEANSFEVDGGVKFGVGLPSMGGFGISAGAMVDAGVLQYIDENGNLEATDDGKRVASDFFVSVRPFAQASMNLFSGLALVGRAGYRLSFLKDSALETDGLFMDLGARLDMDDGEARGNPFELGYRATFLSPTDQRTATQLVPGEARALLIHGLVLGDEEDGGNYYFGYGAADPATGGDTFKYFEFAYDMKLRAFDDLVAVNPFLSARLGGVYMAGNVTASALGEGEAQDRLAGSVGGRLGAEFPVMSFLTLSMAVGYDWLPSANEQLNLSGFAWTAGASFTL